MSQRHKPVEDTNITQTRAEEADDECQVNVSTVSTDNSRVHDSLLYVKLTSLSPEASVFTPAVHNPSYSTPVMENPCLQRSLGSSDESVTGSVHMDNSQEDVCPSDLTTCIDDTDTRTRNRLLVGPLVGPLVRLSTRWRSPLPLRQPL